MLRATTGKPRAWYGAADEEVAIVENSFGKGRALWCGYPVGYLYEALELEPALAARHAGDTPLTLNDTLAEGASCRP